MTLSANGAPVIGTVLIVDDDEKLRNVLKLHLRAAGFDALDANTGAEGVACAREHQPDLVIMDVTMPGMDGVAATRELKADPRTSEIPVIMLTGRSGTDDLVLGYEVGAQEYLTKPFAVAELLARVRTVHRLAVTHRNLNQLNSRLEDEVSEKTQRLQWLYDYMRELSQTDTRDAILDLVVKYVHLAIGARRVSLLMTDESNQYLVCERAIGIDPSVVSKIKVDATQGIAGQVFRSGKMVVAKAVNQGLDEDERYAGEEFLSTPVVSTSLATRDGILGVLNVTERSDDAPFTRDELETIRSITDAAAIALHNVLRRTQLEHSVKVLLETVGFLAEYRDEETTLHLRRVAELARIMAEQLRKTGPYRDQISEEFVEWLVQAAPMHDIGKVGIPDDILTKPGKLTDAEFEIMKTHTEIGRRVLSRALDTGATAPLLEMCIEIAYCHHERYNGRGYPRGLGSQDIPLSARIIALVDAYDAITSHRRYSPAQPHHVASEIIRSEAGQHFDPVLVDAFLQCEQRFDEVRAHYSDQPTGELVGTPA